MPSLVELHRVSRKKILKYSILSPFGKCLAFFFVHLTAVKWLKYCRYGVKYYPINQSFIWTNLNPFCPRMLRANVGLNYPSSSKEEIVNEIFPICYYIPLKKETSFICTNNWTNLNTLQTPPPFFWLSFVEINPVLTNMKSLRQK